MAKYRVYLASHAHIDAEWLWDLDETIEVCKLTFSNVLNLMRKYPELTYIQSSSFFYELMEKHYPEIFQEIKERVKSGNWKVVGGSYLEFDPNMPSGESLVRHFLVGKRYFKEKFGVDVVSFWLPDSFGFPASLPNILVKAGMKYFSTHKMKWNDTTDFPYYVFFWKYVDGSEIVGLHLPGYYNDYLFEIRKVLINLAKMYNTHKIPVLMEIFGRGDHGGGPDEEEVLNIREWKRKYKNIELIYSGLDEFFEDIEKNFSDRLPLIDDDELYLEFHRGVFTTGSIIKWFNRYIESLFDYVEKLYSLLKLYGEEYPKETLDELWKVFMLNHFHDTMSVTVIPKVYMDAIDRARYVAKKLKRLLWEGLKKLSEKSGSKYLMFNPNAWKADVYVLSDTKIVGKSQKLTNGKWLSYVKDLPPLGYKGFNRSDEPSDKVSVIETRKAIILENKYLKVIISKKTGWIVQIYDKKNKRKVLKGPIRIRVYWDYPTPLRGKSVFGFIFSAWEVYNREGLNKYRFKDLKTKDIRTMEHGELYTSVVSTFTYKQFVFWKSTFKMEVGLYADKPYVELNIYADWRTWHRFAKLVIPINVNTDEAIFEIPYGTVRRKDAGRSKNPADRAKYEVVGHKWVDVSDSKYGVAVIDDSKYGYSWINGNIELSLLRSPSFPLFETHGPNPEMDKVFQQSYFDLKLLYINKYTKYLLNTVLMMFLAFNYIMQWDKYKPMDWGTHKIRIWIYPHAGDFVEGNVPKIATELNTKYEIVISEGEKEGSKSLITVSDERVHVTTVKQSEDYEDGLVVRLFNSSRDTVESSVNFNFDVKEAFLVDLIEWNPKKIEVVENSVNLKFAPHEIKTLLIKL